MKNIILVSALLFSAISNAGEGSMQVCTGVAGEREFTINISKDPMNEPEHVAIFDEAKRYDAFSKKQIRAGMVNVGDSKNPFMNYQIAAKSNKSALKIRFPEQDPNGEVIVAMVSGILSNLKLRIVKEVEVKCRQN